jgi:hypothetical protein
MGINKSNLSNFPLHPSWDYRLSSKVRKKIRKTRRGLAAGKNRIQYFINKVKVIFTRGLGGFTPPEYPSRAPREWVQGRFANRPTNAGASVGTFPIRLFVLGWVF